MKKIYVILGLLFFVSAGYGQTELVVDPAAEMRTLGASFNAISISGSIDVYLTQSGTEAIAISAAEEKYKAGIKTVVENNTLKIYFEGEKGFGVKNKKLKAYVSFTTLQQLNASGASDIFVVGKITTDQLDMKLSGASDFKGAVAVGSFNLLLSGASDAKISGTASNASITTHGASDVDAYGLVTDYCEANASGASDINITVNKELVAHAKGSSDISYRGTGAIKEMHRSGASAVGKGPDQPVSH
jgi:hypothetical protein